MRLPPVLFLSKQRNGNTGLHLSARQGHDDIGIVKLFLDYETSVNIRGAGTYTPLMQAAECGHVGTTRLLIDNEADLELRNSDGKTALCSASGDFPDVVSELLTRGSREDVTNNDNETALQQAEKFGCFDVIKIFDAWNNSEIREKTLFEASHEGKTRLVRGLLIAGSDYDFRIAAKEQAIHEAASAGHSDVVRVLIEAGADINSPGQNGNTPLIWASITGQLSTARYLLDSGADINSREDAGQNALHRATLANHLSLVSELLDRKADKSIRNKYRNTALDIARKLNFKEIALLLDDSEISSDDEYQAKVLLLATQNIPRTQMSMWWQI